MIDYRNACRIQLDVGPQRVKTIRSRARSSHARNGVALWEKSQGQSTINPISSMTDALPVVRAKIPGITRGYCRSSYVAGVREGTERTSGWPPARRTDARCSCSCSRSRPLPPPPPAELTGRRTREMLRKRCIVISAPSALRAGRVPTEDAFASILWRSFFSLRPSPSFSPLRRAINRQRTNGFDK